MGATIGSAPPDRSPETGSAPQTKPFVSVVVATRDRPDTLATCLVSLAALDYPHFEVIVVDNCPSTPASAELVARLHATMPWLRYVREDRPGLASAHNCGLDRAGGQILAFTDDDVVVDRHWLTALVHGFDRADNVACVTGLIRPMSLETPAERWAEQAWGIGKGDHPRLFDLGDHRPSDPLFPYSAGSLGSGANMAFRAGVLRALDGFDPAIGTGTRARGGDDLDAFYRVIVAGHALAYEPRASVLHRHHPEEQSLRKQAFGYGAGLTAYLTKIVVGNPRLAITLLPRLPRALLHARAAARPRHDVAGASATERIRGVAARRYLGMLWGPVAYLWSRWETARSRYPVTPDPGDGETPAGLALLLNLDDLSERLCRHLDARDWTNAYLAAAGMNQIAEDYLSGAATLSGRVVRGLAGTRGGVLAGRAQSVSRVIRARAHSRTVRWQVEVAGLCVDLSPVLVGQAAPFGAAGWGERALELRRGLGDLPAAARRDLVRLPSCFHRFDQRPEDTMTAATSAAARFGAETPIFVLGVRTSGSYLAPLQAAALAAAGFSDVGTATVRPGQRLSHAQIRYVRRLCRNNGRVLVVDDAPASGRTLNQVVAGLRGQGVPASAITLVLPLLRGVAVPQSLAGIDAIVVPWEGSSIARQLESDRVAADLADLLGATVGVVSVQRVVGDLDAGPVRGHVEAVYDVELAGPGGDVWSERVAAEGCGLGFFGTGMVVLNGGRGAPTVHGVRGGLLFREWLAPESVVAGLPDIQQRELATDLAGHVATQARRLPLLTDVTADLAGRGTVVDAASLIVARAYGRAASPARAVGLDRVIGRLLQPRHPAVVDGSTELDRWHLVSPDRLVRVARTPGQASRLMCFDPVYDLAGIAAMADDPELETALRARYCEAAGETVDEERWLLYLLVWLWDAGRRGLLAPARADRLASLAMQRYLASRVLGDVECSEDGPLCALDLDGVVEHAVFGWPVATPTSVLALRTLMVHGFRPVPVTGRSVVHVRDLCITFGLPGGAAEYGAVLYERGDEQVIDVVQAAGSQELRMALAARPGVAVDPDYRTVVRARGDLGRAAVAETVAAHPRFSAVGGEGQTDFVPVDVDKGKGLVALAQLLGHGPAGPGPALIGAAVGDTSPDLPMFAEADRAFLLRHADRSLRGGQVKVVRHAYQRGLADAVARLVGHAPGGCERCAPPATDRRARQLLTILAAAEGTSWSVARRVAWLPVRAWVR